MQPDPKKVSRMEDGKWVEQSKYFDGVNFSPIPPARDTLLLPTRERDKRDELPTLLSNLSDAEFPRELIDKIHDDTKKNVTRMLCDGFLSAQDIDIFNVILHTFL